MTPTDPRVLGLDLSLSASGVAYANGHVTTITNEDDLNGMDRIAHIVDTISRAVVAATELVMIEAPVFYPGHMSGARDIAQLNAIMRWDLWVAGVPYMDVKPSTVKKYATGNGNAKKLAVLRSAEKRLGYDGDSYDEADALWLRAVGWAILGVPLLDLPPSHTDALKVLHKVAPTMGATR